MAKRKYAKNQSTGQLDAVIGQGPDKEYVDFYNKQQQDKQVKVQQQKQQQAQKQQTDKQKQEQNKGGFLGKLTRAGGNFAKETVKAVEQPFVDTGKKIEKQVKYLSGSTPTQGERDALIKNQQKATSRDLSPETRKLFKTVGGGGLGHASASIRQGQKMLADGAKEEDVQKYLKSEIQSNTSQTKKAAANAAQIASLGVGAGTTAKVATGVKAGAKALAKPAAINAGAGAVGSAGYEVSNDPEASTKDILKAAGTGAALGAGITGAAKVAGGVAGKLISKTPAGKRIAIRENEKLIQESKPNALSNLTKKPSNELEKLAAKQSAKKEQTAVADFPEVKIQESKPTSIPEAPKLSEAEHTKQTTELSKKYDAEIEAVKTKPTLVQKAEKQKIEETHQQAQNAIDQSAGKELTFPDKPAIPVPEKTVSTTRVAEQTTNNPPALPRQETTPPTGVKTKTGETQAQQGSGLTTQPIAKEGDRSSRVYQRLKAEHPELKDDVSYEAKNLQKDAENASSLVAKDKNKAYRVAMGAEAHPDSTNTAVNIALSEQALAEGNDSLYSQLVKNRSLAQTRRGQELVAEKGSVTDNSTSRYVKELLGARLERLGKSYIGDLTPTMLKGKKQIATSIIDSQVSKAQSKLRNKSLDLREAQSIIDRLAC